MDLRVPDRTGFVDVNRTRLRVWEWGEPDAPAVICAHGAFDHGRMWDGLAPELAGLGWRVVAVDLRGHGDSGPVSSGHAWQAVSIDLACLARALGPPVGLVGHSFGGGQVLGVASVWPELVRWVVNLDGLGPPEEAFAERDLAAAATAGLASFERALGPARVYPTLADMADHRGRINRRLPKAWLDHLVAHGTRPVEGGYTWKVDPIFRTGLPGSFSLENLNAQNSYVTCPVLVLTGTEHDTWNDLSDPQVKERLAHLADARHEVVDGAGHYVHIEQPERVLGAIADFITDIEGDAQEIPA